MAAPDPVVVILYTTLYRLGGAKFARAAQQLARDKASFRVVCQAVESKAEFRQVIGALAAAGERIQELHFIGHSGMYGIMFGSVAWPEQMSPHEWRNLPIPFAAGGRAYFHACRTGRWFAPFFARTFGVTAYGYYYYTTVSRDPRRFVWEGPRERPGPIYIISVPGKKSHGWLGSLRKFLFQPKSFPMLEFKPNLEPIDSTYDSVADLYDETFADISVREDELHWLRAALRGSPPGRVLDIGCGTGSFLRASGDLVDQAVGVDLSAKMVERARRRSAANPKLTFQKIDGPALPFADSSFDTVISILSFRYLDWDPVVQEILRVLKPGGRLLVVDMVASPLKFREIPHFIRDKIKQQVTAWWTPQYRRALKTMVSHPNWKRMLEYNPIRAEHELKWYLQSRFPGGSLESINYALHSRILAFRSAPIFQKEVQQLSYP